MSVSDDRKPSKDDNSVRKYGEQYSNRRHFSWYTTVDETKYDSWSQRRIDSLSSVDKWATIQVFRVSYTEREG